MAEIETKQLNKFYKNLHALKDINLGIKENELFGLLGVNGAGKTTLIKILTCLSEQTSGEAYVHGFSVKDNPEKVKEIVDVSPQETAVAHNLTVRENLDFFASLYNTRDEAYISSVVNAFSLEEVENQRAKTLSGGWKRRLSIAIGLISKPKILFLDEPTLGLDVIARRELWKIINNMKGKITIILTTHYLEEAEALCDRVAVMAKGKVKATGTPAELKAIAKTDNFEDAFIKIAEDEL
ncbi:MAG: ABC transporter ATP-binding protein [Clostridia bacterium]|nr:ABC transporter ATP-binding protein [Clostridia bacterium]